MNIINLQWFYQPFLSIISFDLHHNEKSDRKIRSLLQWEQRESNPRPSACKADALNQLSYAPKLAPEPGLEPGTL